MSETHPPAPGPPQSADPHSGPVRADVRRERSDADVGSIVIFGLSLVGILIIVHFMVHWMFESLEHKEKRADPGLPAVAKDRPRFPKDLDDVPAPVLQRDAEYDLHKLRAQEEKEMNPTGPLWADRKAKTARIAIADALRRIEDPRFIGANGLRFRETPKKGPNGGKK